jgi:uncharacterized protein (TIGR03085 family)
MDFTVHGYLTVWCLPVDKNYAQIERQELCDLFESVGPDHPTLCEGWSAADLAAHLVLRENSLKAVGLVAPGFLAKKLAKATKKLAKKKSFEELVDKVRSGPPFYLKRFDEAMNLFEFFVHHEDVRRGGSEFIPRTDINDLENVLWAKQERFSKLLVRRLKDVDITLIRPSGEKIYLGGGGKSVVLEGTPGEIGLFLFGRREHSEVKLTGDPKAVDEIKTGKLG